MTAATVPRVVRAAGIREVWLSRFVLFATAVVVGAGVVGEFRGVFNSDAAWLLYASDRLLDGATLYRDIIEINPPLIIWLGTPIALAARAFDVSAILTFRLVTLGAIALALWYVRQRVALRGPSATIVWCVLAIVLVTMPVGAFGQREHLALIATVPALALLHARLEREPVGTAEAVLVGLVAGVGLAVKPHFLAVGLVAYGAASGAVGWGIPLSWPEVRTASAVVVGYGLLIPVVTPDYVPMLRELAPVYTRYVPSPLGSVVFGRLQPLLMWWSLLVYLVGRSAAARPHLLDVLAVGTAGFLAAAVLQAKGFSYHYYPGLACGTTLMVAVVSGAVRRRPLAMAGARVFAVVGLAVWLLLFAAPVMHRFEGRKDEGRRHSDALLAFAREHGDAGILMLSPRMSDAFPAMLEVEGRWASRYPFAWFAPTFYSGALRSDSVVLLRQGGEVDEAERALMRSVAEDLVRFRPEHVLIVREASIPTSRSLRLDFVGFFRRDSLFEAEFSHYQPVGSLSDFTVYRREQERGGGTR